VFSPLEVVAVFLTVIIVVILLRNGETNWFEGTLLLSVYAILAITFFYIPSEPAAGYDETAPAIPSRDGGRASLDSGRGHVVVKQ